MTHKSAANGGVTSPHPNKKYIDAYVMGENLEFNWNGDGDNDDSWETLDEKAMDIDRFEAYCRRLISRDQPVTGLSWRVKKVPRKVWVNIFIHTTTGAIYPSSMTYPTEEAARNEAACAEASWKLFATTEVVEKTS